MTTDATRIEEHLRAASDAIFLLLTEVGQLERHKRGIPPGDPRFDKVARSVRVVAQALAELTEHEERWARIATDGRTDIEPIAESEVTPETPWVTVVWNDPVNLMTYVSFVFQEYFGYDRAKSETLMLQVHEEGRAAVSTGSREEMERDVAAMHGYGLWATMQRDS